ncbi:MAG: protein meaA [Alphaproteobacteria bacterium]|nr:protein meaA [Rhodospirillaceae bacterium]MBT6202094.1 protein meaA [Rhodospirillaceae bacterium]MDG2480812.1 protein meaA [Alphaproteobacteria bacterium]
MSDVTTNQTPARNRDKPWLMRTYSGHSTARASNTLYRTNLERGQTGLSIAFDLPTQTGYDADEPIARGEVGRVGVPVSHLGDMETLFDQIPIEKMNTSMTINASAAWLFALYIAMADKRGVSRGDLAGTIQNDIVKEYLSRGTYIFPPAPSLKLTTDTIIFSVAEVPKWNPINVCPYHLQEAGATPVQEIAFALANAIQILDDVKASGTVSDEGFARVVGRISFFVNAGIRFVTEMCKMRAFTELWDEICAQRYGVEDPKLRRFRYGVQVNSLGLTEQQPENNVYRILLEMLAVTLSKGSRARAVQLPAWNEALGLPRPWDQQWSLRLQQIVAHETDLLEFGDIFEGSHEIAARTAELKEAAWAELATIEKLGGATQAVETGYMKQKLVEANSARVSAIEAGDISVIGVNMFTESAPSPLTEGSDGGFMTVGAGAEDEQIENLKAWRAARDTDAATAAVENLKSAAREGRNIMEPSIACAKAGVTTGEWGRALREAFGEYRAPTGLAAASAAAPADAMTKAREHVEAASKALGRRVKLLVGKPGLDGHSNGAEQIALRARDCGMEVVYQGIRLSPEQIAASAVEESVHVVGLSILSGAHIRLVAEVRRLMDEEGCGDIPIVVGGIIPAEDIESLKNAGVARIFTPKDFEITAIIRDIADVAGEQATNAA